jgi:uncharacterized protein (TIGR02246 family)
MILVSGRLGAQPGRALDELRTAWLQALERQDIEASLALFAPDAVFLTPEGSRYDDRAAIRTLYRSVVATYRARISMTSKRQETSPSLGVDQGIYDESLTEIKTGKQVQIHGSYLLVARRQPGGAWKIVELVWTGATLAVSN